MNIAVPSGPPRPSAADPTGRRGTPLAPPSRAILRLLIAATTSITATLDPISGRECAARGPEPARLARRGGYFFRFFFFFFFFLDRRLFLAGPSSANQPSSCSIISACCSAPASR